MKTTLNFRGSLTLALPAGGYQVETLLRGRRPLFNVTAVVGGGIDVAQDMEVGHRQCVPSKEKGLLLPPRGKGASKGMIMPQPSQSYIAEGYECQAKKLRLFPLRQWGDIEGL